MAPVTVHHIVTTQRLYVNLRLILIVLMAIIIAKTKMIQVTETMSKQVHTI